MLTVQNIETHYGASQALFGISMNVRNGEVVTLIGRNGMGKTTSINSIMGITPITRGSIFFENVRIEHLESFKINRKGIALVPEGRQVFPNLTVRENLVAISANRNNHTSPWNLNKILDLFPQLSARIDSMANLLSGGEQQMLAIGRSLMTNPKLLLLDEATEGLAPLVRNEIWRCLNKLKKEGISMLVVDKNIKDLARIADVHYVIEKGQIVWQGNSSELLKQKDVEFELRNYIKNPLELIEIKEIIANLAENIEEIIRKNKEFDYGRVKSQLELSEFIYGNQKLLQRPILFYKKYWICRPPEKALKILGID